MSAAHQAGVLPTRSRLLDVRGKQGKDKHLVGLVKDNDAVKVWAADPVDDLLQAALALARRDQGVVRPACICAAGTRT